MQERVKGLGKNEKRNQGRGRLPGIAGGLSGRREEQSINIFWTVSSA